MGLYGSGDFLPHRPAGGAASILTRYRVAVLIGSSPANATTWGNIVAGNTNYLYFTPDRAATLVGISALANSNPAGSNPTIRLGKAQVADSTLVLTVPAGASRSFSTTGTGVTIAANDKISAAVTTDASWTATALIWTVFLHFEETA